MIDPERPITVTGPDTLVVDADEERLHQVITSLLSNVRIHTPPWTISRDGMSEAGDDAMITSPTTVSGSRKPGSITSFDRFYRADPSRSRAPGEVGSGWPSSRR